MNKNIEVIAMVYASVPYFDFIVNELKSIEVPGWDVGIRIIANDPVPAVEQHIQNVDIPITTYNDKNPDAYYLERVYRAWNFGGTSSTYDNICFVNSDMMFSPNWLTNLLKYHNGINIPCSRLVESGKLRSGQYAISKNFGQTVTALDRDGFLEFAQSILNPVAYFGGLFMPVVFEQKRFVESGMYPEGNVNKISGDRYFFNKLATNYGMKHTTIFDSIVYHIQEGEMDEASASN